MPQMRDGGVSIRRSQKVMVNFGGARRVVLSSDPGGLFATQVSYPEVNSTFSTSNLQGSNGGYVFSHWEVNGQRQADPSGIAYSRLTETMDVDNPAAETAEAEPEAEPEPTLTDEGGEFVSEDAEIQAAVDVLSLDLSPEAFERQQQEQLEERHQRKKKMNLQ